MAVNKVTYGGETLIDLTGDTVTADKLAEGITAHDASGAEIVGTLVASAQKVVAGKVYYSSSSNTSTPTIQHGLGETPNFVCIMNISQVSYGWDTIMLVYNIASSPVYIHRVCVDADEYWYIEDYYDLSKTPTMSSTQVTFPYNDYSGYYYYIIGVI